MNFRISKKILSLPPFLSTKWENIQSLAMIADKLQIVLMDGTTVNIQGLDAFFIEQIFNTHAQVLESEPESLPKKLRMPPQLQNGDNMFQIGFAAVDEFGGAVMQHNPAQANYPDLPPQVLEKISAIAKAIGPEDSSLMPKAEANCNCLHCQIARTIQSDPLIEAQATNVEEEIKPEDLNFQQWEVHQTGDQLFTVVNKLDTHEHYSVFLGTPVGCTCGHEDCEHIVAVLKS